MKEPEHKKVKPICFKHNKKIYLILLGYKTISYDYEALNKTSFAPLSFHVSNSNDLKTVVLNERDLYLYHCSKSRSVGEIFHLDLVTMV